jgi:hypothetical protein
LTFVGVGEKKKKKKKKKKIVLRRGQEEKNNNIFYRIFLAHVAEGALDFCGSGPRHSHSGGI